MKDELHPHTHPIPCAVALLIPYLVAVGIATVSGLLIAGLWFAAVSI